ncbi:MAG: ABC transporter ATP-binding protein [Deltaproteobacteria bacterium]
MSPLFSLSVIDFVMMGRAPYLKGFSFSTPTDEKIAEESLSQVGLLDYKDRWLHTLSAGEKQRALIAKAITQSTPILLLDEPTAHLDLKYQIETLSLLKSLQKKKNLTPLIVLHDFHLASEWSDDVILIHNESIFAQGAAKEVLTEKNILEVFGVNVAIDENPYTRQQRITYLIKDS